MLVIQLVVVALTRSQHIAIAGQAAEVNLDSGLGHLDDGDGCRVLASDDGRVWRGETVEQPQELDKTPAGPRRRCPSPRRSARRIFL